MKKPRYTDRQIAQALRQAEHGTTVAEFCRKLGVSETTFYHWKKKYAGMGVAELWRVKQLEEENRRLKQVVADLTLDKAMLQDVLQNTLSGTAHAVPPAGPETGDAAMLSGTPGAVAASFVVTFRTRKKTWSGGGLRTPVSKEPRSCASLRGLRTAAERA